MDKKHAIILICFQNFEHIKQCFESLENLDCDFFIIENHSERSGEIQKFFSAKKNIKKYLYFKENIANNAMKIFVDNFYDILWNYEYLTFSDCDLLVYESEETFIEIFDILKDPLVRICCVDLDLQNFPEVGRGKGWLPRPKNTTEKYIECDTGVQLMTLRREGLPLILKSEKFLDGEFQKILRRDFKKWVKTKKSKAKHLTWDLYVKGSPYYEFKMANRNIFSENKKSEFVELCF